MSIKNHSDLTTEITADISNNGAQAITGLILQDKLLNLADSAVNKLGDSIQGKLTYSSLYSISASGDIPHKNYVDTAISSSISALDSTFYKKDGSNGPLTGDLDLDSNSILNTSSIFGNSDSNPNFQPGTRNFFDKNGLYILEYSDRTLGLSITSTGNRANLKTDSLTSDRTFQFPDTSGTLALTSDLVSGRTENFNWRFDTSTTASDPGTGRFRANNATPSLVTQLYIDSICADTGFNIDNIFGIVSGNWKIYIQETGNATKFAQYTTTGTYTNNGGWWTVPVTYVQSGSGGGLDNNAKCTFYLTNANSGGGTISLTNTHIFVGNGSNVATDVSLTLNASPGSFSLANTGVLTIPDSNTSTRGFLNSTDWNQIEGNTSTGVLTFTSGITIDVGNTTVSIGAVTGWIVDNETNPASPSKTFVNYGGGTGITPLNLATQNITYFYLDNVGSLQKSNTIPTDAQRRQNLFLGACSHPNHTTINFAKAIPDVASSPVGTLRDMWGAAGIINSGLVASANGANLNFNLTQGYLYKPGVNWITDRNNPNRIQIGPSTPQSFVYRTQTGNGGGFITSIDPTSYDVAGTITAIPGSTNQATIQYIFATINGLIGLQYGQTIYSTLNDAVAAVGKETFVTFSNFANTATLIGVICVTKGATALNNTSTTRFLTADKFGGLLGSSSGISTGTLQTAYNNSSIPQITTSTPLQELQIKRGSAADSDYILAGLNGVGTRTFTVTGAGSIDFTNQLAYTKLYNGVQLAVVNSIKYMSGN